MRRAFFKPRLVDGFDYLLYICNLNTEHMTRLLQSKCYPHFSMEFRIIQGHRPSRIKHEQIADSLIHHKASITDTVLSLTADNDKSVLLRSCDTHD